MTILPLSRAILEDVSNSIRASNSKIETSSKIALDKGKMVMVKPLEYVPEHFNKIQCNDELISRYRQNWMRLESLLCRYLTRYGRYGFSRRADRFIDCCLR